MFHGMPKPMRTQMRRLEEMDAKDRVDGTSRMDRLRQIPPETGRFVALLAASAPQGGVIEIGTSAGYSTLYIALACHVRGDKVTTFEVLDQKAEMARQTFRLAEVEDVVDLVHGDAMVHLLEYENISFCFLDAEKEVYTRCYDIVVPRMVTGGIMVADNVISHEQELRPFVQRAFSDDRVDALVVPIGKGELVCRKT